MKSIAPPFETWRAIIAALRAKGLPSRHEHADRLERQLDQHLPDAMVSKRLTNDVSLRSFWARVELGIPLSTEW